VLRLNSAVKGEQPRSIPPLSKMHQALHKAKTLLETLFEKISENEEMLAQVGQKRQRSA